MLVDFVSGSKSLSMLEALLVGIQTDTFILNLIMLSRFELIRATLNGSHDKWIYERSFYCFVSYVVFSRWLSENITKEIWFKLAEQS